MVVTKRTHQKLTFNFYIICFCSDYNNYILLSTKNKSCNNLSSLFSYPIMETPNGGSNLKHLKCDWLTSSVTSQSDTKNLKDESSFVESGKSQSKINITSDPIMKKNVGFLNTLY